MGHRQRRFFPRAVPGAPGEKLHDRDLRAPWHAKSATIRGVTVSVRGLQSPPLLYHRHQFTTTASLPPFSSLQSLPLFLSLIGARWREGASASRSSRGSPRCLSMGACSMIPRVRPRPRLILCICMQIADGDRFMHTSGSSLIRRHNYTAYRALLHPPSFSHFAFLVMQCLQKATPVEQNQMKQ